jgi:exopolysaccharide biosynthesis polyprenyl glycosylphosphotransferase
MTRVSLTVGSVESGRQTSQQIVAVAKPRRWPDSTPPPMLTRRALSEVAAEIEIQRRSRSSLVLKRIIDIIGSCSGLALLGPLMLLIAVLVKVTSRGPAVFVQERCGLGGRVFRFYKFRTMVVDAEARKADLEHLNEMRGPVFKLQCDPRVTKLGSWLRKSSLDELPQLLNVLQGHMSLVGPRPPTRDEVERYTPHQAQRLSVMPGITGLWQVMGRSSLTDFDYWIELDLQYARRWSLWLDLRILAKTVVVVVLARGAQ